MNLRLLASLPAGCFAALLAAAAASNPDESIRLIKSVGPEGRGNAAAAGAWSALTQAGPGALPLVLAAMDDANDLAMNWLRSAADVIVDRSQASGVPLPVAELGEFLLDLRHDARSRPYAFELLSRLHPAAASRLVPGLVNDPAPALRREAVARLLEEAQQLNAARDTNGALLVFQQALAHAREEDQVRTAAEALRRLGRRVDLPRHFGFLMNWKVIGPFDNTGGRGFDTVYPPERELDFEKSVPGKDGEVRWRDFASTSQFGVIDINKVCGALKGVTAYAYTEFHSATGGPAELRLGGKNSWKLWCNGQYLFGRDEYHRGAEIDQYRMPVHLKPGRNTILVKVCQNEQKEEWTVEWEFQLRVCDASGTALLSTDRPPTPLAALDINPKEPKGN
ncbi:MAG TPA: hypothetical protein VNO52_18210 [Methylomirabilota bacterium]|nr:hypothetical protein [Methylomirabilota bacterium]